MHRTFTDDQFDEWEVYVSVGQPGATAAARVMFVCISTPVRRPRYVHHDSGHPAEAEHDLYHMDEATLVELFQASQPLA